jgi:hypothetical protein
VPLLVAARCHSSKSEGLQRTGGNLYPGRMDGSAWALRVFLAVSGAPAVTR